MGSTVWAIIGFKVESLDNDSMEKVATDRVTGRLHETVTTIMHGQPFLEYDVPRAYAFVKVSLQKIQEFEDMPLAERGLGAVSGGYISVTILPWRDNDTSTGGATIQQEWGITDTSEAHALCGFYNNDGETYSEVMVCFDRITVAPVSGFWRNLDAVIGPDLPCDQTSWGVNIKSNTDQGGNHAIVLETVTSTVVLKAEFPELLIADGATKTVEQEVMFSQVFTNGSSATMKDNFNLKTTLSDTHTFVFQEGMVVDWAAGWKAMVPLLSGTDTTTSVEVSFDAHQLSATSKAQSIDRSAEITLPPMTGCRATARYMKSVLTLNAVLTVEKTYSNGAVATRKVPAEYTSISFDDAEIKLEDRPVLASSTQ